MNQVSEILATLIHYQVMVRDTLEYCLKKDTYDVNLYNEKKRAVLVEVDQHTPLKDVIDHSGDNGAKLEKDIRAFYDEVYGDNSTILKLADDGLRVDHAQHLAIYKHVLPIYENVNAIVNGFIRDAASKQIDVGDMVKLHHAEERMTRGVEMLCLTNDLILLFNDFNKAMADNKGQPSPATNFIGQDIQTVIGHINFVANNSGAVHELDYKEGVEDRVHAFVENITGRRDLKQGQRFPDAMRELQNSISDYERGVETTFRSLYVPAMQALVAQARNDQSRAVAASAAEGAKAQEEAKLEAKKAEKEEKAAEPKDGMDLDIDPATGLPKA